MSDQLNKEYQAAPAATLEQQIMSPNFPKNEREWWAADRIEKLEAALRDILSYVPHGDMPVTIYDNARAALEGK